MNSPLLPAFIRVNRCLIYRHDQCWGDTLTTLYIFRGDRLSSSHFFTQSVTQLPFSQIPSILSTLPIIPTCPNHIIQYPTTIHSHHPIFSYMILSYSIKSNTFRSRPFQSNNFKPNTFQSNYFQSNSIISNYIISKSIHLNQILSRIMQFQLTNH